ncbi:MAG: hypothetical protein KDA21_00085 [Phycisphaerales bacterium]|nr:hypothetical protein [Phycisphaerales bacterium]
MNRNGFRIGLMSAGVLGLSAGVALGDPILPDWTGATFDGMSSVSDNMYFPLQEWSFSAYEGIEDGADYRGETLVTDQVKNILGVDTRVVRDVAYEDGLLVEVAFDWYAQDTDGNVWYFGEHVNNFNYDDDDNFIGVDHEGSWIADGVDFLPGIIMYANPMVGAEYYQEYAPGVAFDFAHVNSVTDSVDIDFGSFADVLNTGEGNFIDGPEIAENKLYGPGTGLVLIEVLDDAGEVDSEVELIAQRTVPAPGPAAALLLAATGALGRRRR